jgi:hypothetical protein
MPTKGTSPNNKIDKEGQHFLQLDFSIESPYVTDPEQRDPQTLIKSTNLET